MSENIRMLGRLITDSELYDLGVPEHFTNVYRDSNGNMNLTLKPLSKFPASFPYIDKVLCSTTRIDPALSDYTEDHVARLFEKRLIVFRPVEAKIDYYAYDQTVLPQSSYLEILDEEYISVPCFDLKKLDITEGEFHYSLKTLKPLLVEPPVSDETIDKPEFVFVKIWDPSIDAYDIYLYFNIVSLTMRDGVTKLLINMPEYNRIKLNMADVVNVIEDPVDSIIFIPTALYESYVEQHKNDYMDQEEYLVPAFKEAETLDQIVVAQDEEEGSVVEDRAEDIPLNEPELQNQENDLPSALEVSIKEVAILTKMKEAARAMHLVYSDEDLINFYVSAHSSNLIVLAGMSGTGKSRLIKVYAKALGLDEYNGIKFISVSPAWTDDTDLLGYVDYKNMMYREAGTELVTFLKTAAENRDKQYVVCFDEMNLARVEHYFSPFLSILEDPEEERLLTVYNKALDNKLENSSDYPSKIRLWNNVLFAGTVNIDESTFNFSDKVLDRANVIKLGMRPFTELKAVLENCCLSDRELSVLTELHEAIKKSNPKLGIGYRIVKQINSYINNIPKDVVYSRALAFDKLIVQRIITKLRGSEEQLNTLIGRLSGEDKLVDSNIESILDKYSDVSDFIHVRDELKNKAKELVLYGYSV